MFSWYKYVLNISADVYIVTAKKENGLPNTQLNAWGMLPGFGRKPKYMLQMMNNSDTFLLNKANREFVVNFPGYGLKKQFMKTTKHYPPEADEISASSRDRGRPMPGKACASDPHKPPTPSFADACLTSITPLSILPVWEQLGSTKASARLASGLWMIAEINDE